MKRSNLSSDPWLADVRRELPVLDEYVYLNSGTAGPLPVRAARAIEQTVEGELHQGRGNFAAFGTYFALIERCRALCARLLGADPDEVALTHHTSDGIGIVLTAFDWRPGDRIITTTLEHDAVCVPLGLLRERYGVKPEFVDIGMGEAVLDRLDAALLDGARLVVLSHVVFSSGATLPLQQIAARCKDAGVALLVDGAQTCGARPVDVHALGVDFYTLSGQKWICGPEGTGALYVRRDWIDRLRPARGSYFTVRRHDFRANIELHETARRFELGIVHRPAWAAFAASAAWILDEIGLERAWQRASALTEYAREQIAAIARCEIISPREQASQLLSFTLSGWSPQQLSEAVIQLAKEQKILIRSTPTTPHALRASMGFFNHHDDVDRLAAAIADLARQ